MLSAIIKLGILQFSIGDALRYPNPVYELVGRRPKSSLFNLDKHMLLRGKQRFLAKKQYKGLTKNSES